MEKELSSWKSRSGLLEKETNRLQQLDSELEKQIVALKTIWNYSVSELRQRRENNGRFGKEG